MEKDKQGVNQGLDHAVVLNWHFWQCNLLLVILIDLNLYALDHSLNKTKHITNH